MNQTKKREMNKINRKKGECKVEEGEKEIHKEKQKTYKNKNE